MTVTGASIHSMFRAPGRSRALCALALVLLSALLVAPPASCCTPDSALPGARIGMAGCCNEADGSCPVSLASLPDRDAGVLLPARPAGASCALLPEAPGLDRPARVNRAFLSSFRPVQIGHPEVSPPLLI
jgi:hypothetical protein